MIYPEEAAIARQLHAEGKQPTDRHPYAVHVAYELLSAAEEAAGSMTFDEVLDEFAAEYPDGYTG